MASPWEVFQDQFESDYEYRNMSQAERAKLDAEIQEWQECEAALAARFTFDGTELPWQAARRARDEVISARKGLTQRCRAGPDPPVPEWQSAACDKLRAAEHLVSEALRLIEANPK